MTCALRVDATRPVVDVRERFRARGVGDAVRDRADVLADAAPGDSRGDAMDPGALDSAFQSAQVRTVADDSRGPFVPAQFAAYRRRIGVSSNASRIQSRARAGAADDRRGDSLIASFALFADSERILDVVGCVARRMRAARAALSSNASETIAEAKESSPTYASSTLATPSRRVATILGPARTTRAFVSSPRAPGDTARTTAAVTSVAQFASKLGGSRGATRAKDASEIRATIRGGGGGDAAWALLRCAWREAALPRVRLDAGDALDPTADGVDASLEDDTYAYRYACDESRAMGGARGTCAVLRETLLPPAREWVDFDAAEALHAAMRESKSASVAARRVAARRARGRAVVPGTGVERWTIHGGTAGLGIAACAWLDAREVRDIVLAGRSGGRAPPKYPAAAPRRRASSILLARPRGRCAARTSPPRRNPR